jgi:hypothetical protein
VIWDPDQCGGVLRARAFPVQPASGLGEFRLAEISCSWNLFLQGDRRHLVLCDQGRSIQLCVFGAALLKPVHLLVDLFPIGQPGRDRLETLRSLQRLAATGWSDWERFQADPRGIRLRTVLRALDGRRAGASDREIAIAAFGKARVNSDWNHPGGHRRDHVRRAVHRGHALVNGGYRALLR